MFDIRISHKKFEFQTHVFFKMFLKFKLFKNLTAIECLKFILQWMFKIRTSADFKQVACLRDPERLS